MTNETRAPDLEAAAQLIEIIAMLEEKTRGNLTPKSASCSTRCSSSCACASSKRRRRRARSSSRERRCACAAARVTFLGTGTSHGVPMIGCACATCHSTDPRDRRLAAVDPPRGRRRSGGAGRHVDRPAAAGADARPDARRRDPLHAQPRRPRHGARRGAALQHAAARRDPRLRRRARPPTTCAARSATSSTPPDQQGGGMPQIDSAHDRRPVHGRPRCTSCRCRSFTAPRPILGFRFGSFAYLTDCSRIPDASLPLLAGSRRPRARRAAPPAASRRTSPSREALDVVERVEPRRDALHAHLPRPAARRDQRHAAAGVELAYDGLTLDVNI